MILLPFNSFQIHSHLSSDEVKQALEKNVAKRTLFSLSGIFNEQPYRGEISDDSFKIIRNIHYKNSFVPVIRGRVTDAHPGTIVEVKMRMAVFVFVFMIICFGIMFFVAAMSGSTTEPLFMIGMFAVFYVIAMIAYKYEVGKAKRFLINLFGEQKFIPDNRYPTADLFDLLIRKDKGGK